MPRIIEKIVVILWTAVCALGLGAAMAMSSSNHWVAIGMWFAAWLIVVVPVKLIAMVFIKSPSMTTGELFRRRVNS